MIQLRVNDLKQYAYCPRIIFYQYVMPVDKAETYKMGRGRVAEAEVDELEKRRGLSRYGLDKGVRRFHVFVKSERLGLSGKLDLLIETPEALIPVDFKLTSGDVQPNHVLQLCGYALILEDSHAKPVERGFVYLIPQKDVREVVFTEATRKEAMDAVAAIRKMIEGEILPTPTVNQNRCEECEFRNYCNDVV